MLVVDLMSAVALVFYDNLVVDESSPGANISTVGSSDAKILAVWTSISIEVVIMGSGEKTVCFAVAFDSVEEVGCGAERAAIWMSALIEVSTSAEGLPLSMLTRGSGF